MSSQPLLILLVDDDIAEYELTREYVADIGHDSMQLRWAHDLDSMLGEIAQHDIDAILMDFYLGEYTGIELIDELKSRNVQTPVILLTGRGSRAMDMDAMAGGAVDYLEKRDLNAASLDRTIRYAVERARLQQLEHDTNSRYRSLIENIPAAFFIAPAGNYLQRDFVSPQLRHMFGSPDFHNSDWAEMIDPAEHERYLSHAARCDANGEPASINYRFRHTDGTQFWVREDAILVYGPDGLPLHWHGVVYDITAERSSEAALRSSEARFKALVQYAPDCVMITNASGTFQYVSPAFEHMLGHPLDLDVNEYTWIDFVHPGDRWLFDEAWQTTLANPHAPITSVYRARDIEGVSVWVEVISTSWLDDEHIQGVVFNVRNISQRMHDEEHLKRLSAIVTASEDAIFSLLFDGTITSWNPGATRMFGYDAATAVGNNITFLYPPDRPDEMDTIRAMILSGQSLQQFRTKRMRSDGTIIDVSLTISPIRDVSGEMTGTAVTARDITEQLHLISALRTSENNYRMLMEQAADGIVVAGPDGVIQSANHRAGSIIGYPPEEITGAHLTTFIAPDDLAHAPLDADVLRNGGVVTRERVLIRKDGSSVITESSSTLLTDGRVQIIIRDISERKSAEEHIRFQARLLDAVEQAVIATDRGGTILYWNRHAGELFGWPSADTVGKSLGSFVPFEDPDTSFADIFTNISTGAIWTGEQPLARQDGSQFWGHVTRSPVEDATGTITGMIVVVMDISQRHSAETALQESEIRFRSAFDSASIGMAIINRDRTFQKLNPAILDLLGYEEHELIGLTADAITHPDDAQMAIPLISQMLSGVIDSFKVEKRYIHKDGSIVWCLLSSAVVRDDRDNVMYSLSQFTDITDRKQLEEQLSHHALHDALTGLPNRTLLTDRLEQVISVAHYTGGTVAVLFLDIDNFKVVNDSLGHEAGDRLLVEVGTLLRQLLRADHTVARFGGDEFVIVGQVEGVAEAIQTAEMILEYLRKPLIVESREIVVSFSIGIALGERSELDGHDLLRHADLAMYRAKSIGKNRFEMFDSGLQSTVIERLELEHDLRRAIELDELSLVYQPIIELASGRIVALEALLRWNHHQRKMIPPDLFIPIAEESGLIVEIGKWVVHTACQQAAAWETDPGWPEDLRININLSARQFQQPDLSTMIADALIQHGIGGNRLRVEITESDVMDDPDQAIARLCELKQLGISTAIDDFGTGYSSLSVLHAFPIDILKIDRSFIAAMEQEPNGTPIVSATISLAHNLGLLAVAEGIETTQQLTILRNLGCDRGQGYFFARPLPVEDVAPLVLGSVAPGTGKLQPPTERHENTLLGTVAVERHALQRKPSLHRKPS